MDVYKDVEQIEHKNIEIYEAKLCNAHSTVYIFVFYIEQTAELTTARHRETQ